MKKRIICLLLILSMLLTLLPVTALADFSRRDLTANPFRDVDTEDWYHDAVTYVCAHDLFAGISDTRFDPNGTMTRGMFVTVLGRLAGVDAEQYAGMSAFADVSPDDYFAPYAAWAAHHGITNGTGQGLFSPHLPIDRQQLACFIVRYFEIFGMEFPAAIAPERNIPADLEQVASWAKDAVVQMWQAGLLIGDGTSFGPAERATRAQTAQLCARLDTAVEQWYREPGEVFDGERTPIWGGTPGGSTDSDGEMFFPDEGEEAHDGEIKDAKKVIRFYDGDRLIDEKTVFLGKGLTELPAVEKSSKEGAVLLGYYYDKEFTKPFMAGRPVISNTSVYAKYQELEPPHEELTVRTFTQLDQTPDLEFTVTRISNAAEGEPEAALTAASLASVDGSDPVELAARDNGDGTYTLYAPKGFREGSSYELTLDDSWCFAGKEETIRTASFSIAMEEVENLRMGEGIIYIKDTPDMDYTAAGADYEVLTSDVLEQLQGEEGAFAYEDSTVAPGDLLCVYVGVHPEQRAMNSELLDPAIYVQVTRVEDDTVYFTALDETAQQDLYEVPDNFPILAPSLPEGTEGTVNLGDLDISMYETMIGKDMGTLENAREKLSIGDFVTIYVSDLDTTLTGDESELYFGRVEAIDGDEITYTKVTKQDLLDSMDLHANIDVATEDILTENEIESLQLQILSQVENSGFAEDAAAMLLDLAIHTEDFREDASVQNLLVTDADGSPLTSAQLQQLGSSFSLNDVDLDVFVGTGSRFGGLAITISVDAKFTVEAEDGSVIIQLSADFAEEASIAPGVDGELVYKEILGIPVPIGVYVSAHVDVMNFTSFAFDAQVTTKANDGGILSDFVVTDQLDDVMELADNTGLSGDYNEAIDTLLARYSQMINQETDWIQLVEEEFFSMEYCVYGIALGVSTSFVIRSDMSIALGSSLEYEVGKRYSMWFRIGLFEPTAGSDTMDLIDEQFAFRFYVMGRLGLKAGLKAKIYAGLGSGKIASIGLAAELGPYIKLQGVFIYDYTRERKAGTDNWITESHMTGGLLTEFGLYLILSFEAEALGLFEYSYDFMDEEFPLLNAGEEQLYFRMNYRPAEDERVFIWDEDRDASNGITMELPESLRVLDCLFLKTGVVGTDLLGYENFSVTLSDPDFTFDPATGKISVNVPERVRYKECFATVTYLGGKAAFTNYDISTTVPLIWTDLSFSELKEYSTASVRVGNAETGYETVWTRKVLDGQPFDLPSEEAIRDMIGWSDLKYADAPGYTDTETSGLTINTDTLYTFEVNPRVYELTVSGIEAPDGSEAEPRTYTAAYGETFDFSDLAQTGTDDPENGIFTAFYNVTTDTELPTVMEKQADGSYAMAYAPMDLSLPITGSVAEALADGNVEATANYVDDSTTAIFTFNGLTHEDVVVKLRKGDIPSMDAVEDVLEAEVLKNNGQPLGISELYPVLGPIDRCTNYVVTCTGLSGDRANITFDCTGGLPLEPVDKLVGSLIVNIPVTTRRGYTFRGWFTEPGGAGQNAFTQTVPAEGITIYAHWTPNPYLVTFHMNGGDGNVPDPVIVTYDALYGEGNHYIYAPEAEFGMIKGEAYGDLPTVTYTGHKFLGWSTAPDRKADGALRTEDSTVADIYDEDHTVYAQWVKLEAVPKNVFDFGSKETYTYDGTDRTADYTIDTSLQYTFTDYDSSTKVNFTEELLSDAVIEYKRQGILSEWSSTAVNAGIYDVRVTRQPDENFAYFEAIYYGALQINKAESHMYDTPTANCIADAYYGNLVMDPDWITNYDGDGTVEFAVTTSTSAPSESAWTSGIIYNSSTSGSFYLWTRLSEGDNYKASNAVRSESEISRPGSAPMALLTDSYGSTKFAYVLQVKTDDEKYSGTSAAVYATIGGNKVKLDKSGVDDHETGDSRGYRMTLGSSLTGKSSLDVTISLSKEGTNPGWKLGSLQLKVYKLDSNGNYNESSPLMTSNTLSCKDWFLTDDYPRSSKTYTLTGLGWNLSSSISGPTGTVDVTDGRSYSMTVDHTMTDGNRGLTFNAYQRRHAPAFVAYFKQDPGFNKYLNWYLSDGQWVCSFDCDDIYDRMMEIGIYQLTLSYGISGKGLKTVYLSVPLN